MRTFDDIYANAPVERREALSRFRQEHPPQQRMIDGVEWEFLACGQGEESLIILGGGGSRADSGFGTITRLENRYRLLSPSYPLAGKVDVVVDGLAKLMESLGMAKAHIYGHSLGSAIGHVLVRRHPERVGKMILGSFGLYNPKSARRGRSAIRLMNRLPWSVIRSSYRSRMGKSLDIQDAGERAFMSAYLDDLFDLQLNKKIFMGQMNLLVDLIDRAAAYQVDSPVDRPGRVLLMLARDDNGFSGDEQQALVDTYPGAQVEWFESGGHLIQYTRRERYQVVFDQFLEG
jgi:pimeloyl-ACP methyl ester carboxylesterase